jgi:hypothetical protein
MMSLYSIGKVVQVVGTGSSWSLTRTYYGNKITIMIAGKCKLEAMIEVMRIRIIYDFLF